MTALQQQEIAALVTQAAAAESQAAVADTCGVSPATISNLIAGKIDQIGDKMWQKIGASLGWRPTSWQLAETSNTRLIHRTLNDAKERAMWVAISHSAGGGKTANLRAYYEANRTQSVFYYSCKEQGKKEFLVGLAKAVGIDTTKLPYWAGGILDLIVDLFKGRAAHRPLLILDEFDKLRSASRRQLIPLYNELEGQLGVVISGTDALKTIMERDAEWNRTGGEELLSRFGRRFVTLIGGSKEDVAAICAANGVTDKASIDKVWQESEPVNRVLGGATRAVAQDMRRVKRAIEKILIG